GGDRAAARGFRARRRLLNGDHAMRMVHYFSAAALLLLGGLVWTVLSGLTHDGSDAHFTAGLVTSILAIAAHTLLILFMIVTGRVLKEAMRTRPMGPEFLDELNRFFARK